MKKLFLSVSVAAVVAVAGLGFSSPANATGVPVVDALLNTQTQTNQAANIAKYIEQIAQLKSQLDQMKQQYESITGTRNLGEILNNPAFQNYLPQEWQDVYSKVQNGGYKGLTGSAALIRTGNQLFDTCAKKTGADKTLCERSASKAAQDKAFAVEAFDKAKDRWDQIAGLMRQINSTTDPKAIAELQARINAEGAAIQNEQTKMQLFALASQAEDRLIEQQQREKSASNYDSTHYADWSQPVQAGSQ